MFVSDMQHFKIESLNHLVCVFQIMIDDAFCLFCSLSGFHQNQIVRVFKQTTLISLKLTDLSLQFEVWLFIQIVYGADSVLQFW